MTHPVGLPKPLRLVPPSEDIGQGENVSHSAVQGRKSLRASLQPGMPLRERLRQEAARREAMARHPAGKARPVLRLMPSE